MRGDTFRLSSPDIESWVNFHPVNTYRGCPFTQETGGERVPGLWWETIKAHLLWISRAPSQLFWRTVQYHSLPTCKASWTLRNNWSNRGNTVSHTVWEFWLKGLLAKWALSGILNQTERTSSSSSVWHRKPGCIFFFIFIISLATKKIDKAYRETDTILPVNIGSYNQV